MASADFSAEHTRILQLTGWTADEIHSLVHERKCPDHWWEDPRPTFGLMEIIRKCVDDTESLSFRKDFVNILKSMGIKEPNCTLPGILSKVKRSALKAISADNLESLCEEYTDLSGSNRVIGSACQQLGITPGLLKEGCSNLQGDISNGIVVELFHYRRRNSIPWKTVLDDLLHESTNYNYVQGITLMYKLFLLSTCL
nr:uncharacterized protein LOC129280670 [Lytechinus pictus]